MHTSTAIAASRMHRPIPATFELRGRCSHTGALCAVLPLARVQEDSPMPETSWLAACKDKAAEFVNATPEARWVLEPLLWVGSA
jgi:hypothetical protein